jgi:molybdopterin/thiamine biosynthesis adenylyltransferase
LVRPVRQARPVDPEPERYERQVLLFDDLTVPGTGATMPSGADLQRRLANARVLVIGVGGLGSWVAASLAAAGLGALRVVDTDDVETSNLSRQVVYGVDDVGQRKLDSLDARLRAMNPAVGVERVPCWIDSAEAIADLLDDVDVVVNCADHPSVSQTSAWVADACMPAGTPHIVGGGYAYSCGVLGMTVIPGVTACWRCLELQTPPPPPVAAVRRGRSMPGPGIAMFSGLVGNVLAWEATRLVLGVPPLLANRWGELHFGDLSLRWRAVPRARACSACPPPDPGA